MLDSLLLDEGLLDADLLASMAPHLGPDPYRSTIVELNAPDPYRSTIVEVDTPDPLRSTIEEVT